MVYLYLIDKSKSFFVIFYITNDITISLILSSNNFCVYYGIKNDPPSAPIRLGFHN